jgi:hypothetical protein
MFRTKTWLLAVPILLVDLATFSNLFEAYDYFEHRVAAVLVATAFAALQIGSLVLYSQRLPHETRRWLFTGAAILLSITGLANVAMAYLRGRSAFPAEGLLPALGFGGSGGDLGVAAAWIAGLGLVVTGLIFWSAFGQHVRLERERQERAAREFEEFLSSRRS